VRATAIKDLHDAVTKPQTNNLYLAWGQVTETEKTKARFLQWVKEFCDRKMSEHRV
jgi:hypothetical protein